MIYLKKVLSLPAILAANTLYLHGTEETGLILTMVGQTNEIVRSTQSKEEIFAIMKQYVDGEIIKMKQSIPDTWTTIKTFSEPGWAGNIYIQQTSGDFWRIKKVDANGVTTYSYSASPTNTGVAVNQAWSNKTSLVYT